MAGDLSLWRGTKKMFDELNTKGLVRFGRVYFVGDSEQNKDGFADSKSGVIYIGKEDGSVVRFGTYSSLDNVDDIIAELRLHESNTDIHTSKAEKNTFVKFSTSFSVTNQYNSSHAGENEYMKVLSIPANTNVIINVVSNTYGYPSNDTIWISNKYSVSVDSLKGSYSYYSYGQNKSMDLLLPVKRVQGEPPTFYEFQIVYCSRDTSLLVKYEDEYLTGRVKVSNTLIIPHPAQSEDTRTFNVSEKLGIVSLLNCTDFIGNITDSYDECVVRVSDEEIGQMYRFTFTKKINNLKVASTGGILYAEYDGEIAKGDVITFTSVSNTENGWLVSRTKAGITSEDKSVDVSWEDGVADLSVKGALSIDDKYRVENGVIINTYGKKGISFNVGDEWISVGGYELNKIDRNNGISVISKLFQHYISKKKTDGTILSDEDLYKIVDYNNMCNLYDKVADIPTMIAISKHLIGGGEVKKKYTITEDGATIPNDATDVVITIVDETKREFSVQLPTSPSDCQVVRVRCIGCINQYGSNTGCNIYYFKADGTKRTNYVSNHYEVMFYTWFEDLGTWQYRYEYPV